MQNQLTTDGAIFLAAFAAIALCLLLYIIIQAIRGKGIAVLPDWLVPGDWWDICIHRNFVLISAKHKDDPGLMAHVRAHLAQQARDGTITFWWRYLTDKRKRLDYEIDAYRAWLDVSPKDRGKVLWWLTHNYNAGMSGPQIEAMLNEDTHGAT